MLDEDIILKLNELNINDLVELQYAIKHILEEREVSEDVIKEALEFLYRKNSGSVRFTQLTLYLEKTGLKRESISKKVIEMWKKYYQFAESGCPIGEEASDDNPIYPIYEGERFHHICYLKPKYNIMR